ncbi:MAG: FGGY-family carbohydrate kinase [Anaerolineales bacterium]
MTMNVLIGLDIGTTNVKAAAYNQDGALLAESSATYPTHYPEPGWAEQDPLDWETSASVVLTELVAQLGDNGVQIAALGISAHAPGLIPVDDRGQTLLKRIPIWQDERSFKQGHRLLKEIGAEWVGLGMPFAAFGPKLRWFTETHPDLAQKTAYALGVKAYLLHWLTREYATDPSSEPGRSSVWERLCCASSWSIEKLVPVRRETKIIGELRDDLARDFGIPHPVPVIIGLNDGASATLGNGAAHPGEAVITLGTNGVIFVVSDQPIPSDIRLRDAIFCWPFIQDRWIIGGQTKSGAASLQWFMGWIQPGSPDNLEYSQLLEESAEVPAGSRGVTFLPYLIGKGTPRDDPLATGSFIGLSLLTRRRELARAVLEGVAFTLRDAMQALSVNNVYVEKMMITGGGARSELWRQILANVLNRPLHYCDGDSCLGAAMLAAVGIRIYPDVDIALENMKPETIEIHPQTQAVETYERLYHAFEKKRDVLFDINNRM